jgi:hypothetical protein
MTEKKIVSAEEIESSETLLEELMDELDKDPQKVIYLKQKKDDKDPIAVLVSPTNEVYQYAKNTTNND